MNTREEALALDAADAILRTWDRSAETVRAVDAGRALGRERPPAPRALDSLPIKVSATGEVEIIDMEFKAGTKNQIRII